MVFVAFAFRGRMRSSMRRQTAQFILFCFSSGGRHSWLIFDRFSAGSFHLWISQKIFIGLSKLYEIFTGRVYGVFRGNVEISEENNYLFLVPALFGAKRKIGKPLWFSISCLTADIVDEEERDNGKIENFGLAFCCSGAGDCHRRNFRQWIPLWRLSNRSACGGIGNRHVVDPLWRCPSARLGRKNPEHLLRQLWLREPRIQAGGNNFSEQRFFLGAFFLSRLQEVFQKVEANVLAILFEGYLAFFILLRLSETAGRYMLRPAV